MPNPSASRTPQRCVQPGAAKAQPSERSPLTVLIVDDDETVRITTAMILGDLGYSALESGTGEGALELLREHPDVALLLTDVLMPGMNGAELARQARAMRPGLPIVFFSGNSDSVAGGPLLQPVLRKPFRASELVARIEAALGARDAQGAEGTDDTR
jgi:two-component system, cell cycle sensor histidine kinase and response regulator CckA